MKHLPPTLRTDHRYVKISIEADEPKSFSEAVQIVKYAVKDFAGEKGLAEVQPWLIKRKFDESNQQAAVRVNKDYESLFRASMTLSKHKIITVNCSGTLKSL